MLVSADDCKTSFLDLVESRRLRVGVIGLGYAGLPVALASSEAGFTTVGIDIDRHRCETLNAGGGGYTEAGSNQITAALAAGTFEAVVATDDGFPPVDAVFICVPTPFTGTPDLRAVQAASLAVSRQLRAGMLVVLQSTSYPGTTREIVQPILERSGLRVGTDFFLAFASERVDPGNVNFDMHNTPKVVGGTTKECTANACALLGAILNDVGLVHPVDSPAIAEMSKLLENTYRMVNIALVNEFSVLAHTMGIDFDQVVRAAASKPFGFASFRPGVGPGGECIPVDPLYLSWKAREIEVPTRLIDAAVDVNRGMATQVVQRIAQMLDRRGASLALCRVLCLGITYKTGVADVRNSRAVRIVELLSEAGASVEFADPMVPTIDVMGHTKSSVPLAGAPDRFDAVVILVEDPLWHLEEFISRGIPVFDATGSVHTSRGVEVERM
jgi:UDP-N-acetyl-D-glucosamine dehydrogenase